MSRPRLETRDLIAIATGGALGATARWAVASVPAEPAAGGWFTYAPNNSVTLESNFDAFERAGSARTLATASGIPLDTLAVNLLGCLLLGALTLLLVRSIKIPRRALIGAATGFCGSLTTFSTFAVEVATMLRAQPALATGSVGLNVRFERDTASLTTYVLLSIVGGALAFALGRFLARRIVRSPGEPTIGGER